MEIKIRNVRGEYKAVADEVLEWCLAVKGGRQNEQRVEPAPRLVNSFGNEVTGKAIFKFLLVLKWIMILSIWHTATLEPAVKHFRNASKNALSSRRWNCKAIDTMTGMKIC